MNRFVQNRLAEDTDRGSATRRASAPRDRIERSERVPTGEAAAGRQPAARRACASAAFTLIEVLVALALLGMIMSAIYTSWHSIVKGSKVALDAAAASQRARITMSALHDSLLCSCMFTANSPYYSFLADSQGELASLSFVARLPKSFPRSGRFGDLEVRRVSFSVEPGRNRSNQLLLRQSPLFMDADADERENPLVLAKDVNKFILEFLDPKTGDWLTEWAQTNSLPKMVRVTLALGRLDQFSTQAQEVRVAVVTLPEQPVRAEWQVPASAGLGPPGLGPTNGMQLPGQNFGQNSGQNPFPNQGGGNAPVGYK